MAKVHRTRRRLFLLLVIGLGYLDWTNPTPASFQTFVERRYPVASFVQRATPITLTGSRDFVVFSVYGVQNLDKRRHYVGVCGGFWEI